MKYEMTMLFLIFAAISTWGMFISMDIKNISDELKYINDTLKKLKAIYDGTAIPENATNGDMIKALFPNQDSDAVDSVALLGLDGYVLSTFPKSWWNALYERGETE